MIKALSFIMNRVKFSEMGILCSVTLWNNDNETKNILTYVELLDNNVYTIIYAVYAGYISFNKNGTL